ncbi:uncharacterized protein LOC105687817 [Athalia rosae]|uniref:uncharacterized protein LOC105687817 n=1 Tax=Athalia rosae TaxID=37344 RepID=UPI0020341891|nr:uncharacterized protein LOC105687817 [Athalia rosae]
MEAKNVANPSRVSWLEEKVVPKIVAALGKTGRSVRCEIRMLGDGLFISAIHMIDLIFPSPHLGEDRSEILKFVMKSLTENESIQEFLQVENLLLNEILFYENFGKNYTDYPKCVLTIREPLERTVLVLENVTSLGYESFEWKNGVDMKRTLAAVRELGKLHARGYVLKENNPKEFFEIVENIYPCKFDASASPRLIYAVNNLSMRPLNYLKSVNYDPLFCEKMSVYFEKAHEKIFRDCVTPRNELAVFCHGDITANNILFRVKNDGEFDAMLIDFAQFRYSSPAIDTSTFIFMSCDVKLRREFPRIFKAYHDVLYAHLVQQGIQNLERFSYDAFFDDYKRHAIFGCLLAIFYIPYLHLDPETTDFAHLEEDIEVYVRELGAAGGNDVSKKLADMLMELKAQGCLDYILTG